jgi:hypothetical protein
MFAGKRFCNVVNNLPMVFEYQGEDLWTIYFQGEKLIVEFVPRQDTQSNIACLTSLTATNFPDLLNVGRDDEVGLTGTIIAVPQMTEAFNTLTQDEINLSDEDIPVLGPIVPVED